MKITTKCIFLVFALINYSIAFGGQSSEDAYKLYYQEKYEESFALFYPLAKQGDSYAQMMVGMMFQLGRGVPESAEQSGYWYRQSFSGAKFDELNFEKTKKLADDGQVTAQFNLGVMYSKGSEIEKNPHMAAVWYQRAAEAGHAGAQLNLGQVYSGGVGVDQDYKKAIYWYEKSAKQEMNKAQYNLGYLHAKGLGVPKDMVVSYHWFNLAAASGLKEAQEALRELERLLAPEQIAAAQTMTRNHLNRVKR